MIINYIHKKSLYRDYFDSLVNELTGSQHQGEAIHMTLKFSDKPIV